MHNFYFYKRKITNLKDALNPLGIPETYKIKIHPCVFCLNLKYTQLIFCPNSNMLNLYLTCPSKLTDVDQRIK